LPPRVSAVAFLRLFLFSSFCSLASANAGSFAKVLLSWRAIRTDSRGIHFLPRHYAVNAAVCGRLHYIYTELPRDVRGVVTIDTFVTFFKIRQVHFSSALNDSLKMAAAIVVKSADPSLLPGA
jgi:hypothetical protein